MGLYGNGSWVKHLRDDRTMRYLNDGSRKRSRNSTRQKKGSTSLTTVGGERKSPGAAHVNLRPILAAGHDLRDLHTDMIVTLIEQPTQCRYCRSTAKGRGCPYSPTGVHAHTESYKVCEFCRATSYGFGCPNSHDKRHFHGQDGVHCRWCGSTSSGAGCRYSPTRRHEK